MATKRTRRASLSFQNTKTPEDVFTSGDKSAYAIDSPSIKGRVTKSRHSTTCLNLPTTRRQTMLTALKEISQSPPAKVEEKGATKPSAASKLIKTPTKNTKVSAKDFTPGRPARFDFLERINMTPLPDSLEKKKNTEDFYETSVKSPVTKKRNIAMQLKKRKVLTELVLSEKGKNESPIRT